MVGWEAGREEVQAEDWRALVLQSINIALAWVGP